MRVNAVAPGMVRTAMAEQVYADEVLHEKRRSMVPVGRIGQPEDIGKAVAFLLSDRASAITGTNLVVDGGLTADWYSVETLPGYSALPEHALTVEKSMI